MIKKVIIFVLVFSAWMFDSERANGEVILSEQKYDLKSIVILGIGGGFSSGSDAFFDVFLNEFGSTKRLMAIMPTLSAGTKVTISPQYRFGFHANFQVVSFSSSHGQMVDEPGLRGYRNLHQNFEITNMPLFLSLDYMPYTSQFRTYSGLGLGMVVINTKWEEGVSSTIEQDTRIGGLHYEDTDIGAFGRVYAGVELGFDKNYEDYFLGSLIIEASYSHTIVNADMFYKVRQQFNPPKESLNQKVNFVPGYLQLSVNVSFNFNRKVGTSKQRNF
ncbi:MAG: hypothetical protein M9949_11745 [Candidatus Kapabacteria bacterium]|jgi:hypothetical protein|nr:hypothetical protein [Candidatus Kapabacteria bacterium]